MRTYGQYCGLAKALDVVGDRWTLLIVRELLIRGACRYSDLQRGLPGIATNLLAERLRDLEEASVVDREEVPPPVAATLFRLTARGKELEPAVRLLGLWGAPLLAQANSKDTFCSHWLTIPLAMLLEDGQPKEPAVEIELQAGEEPVAIEVKSGEVRVRLGSATKPDAVLIGDPRLLLGVLTAKVSLSQAVAEGMRFVGKRAVLQRVTARKSKSQVPFQ
jgi:DNA-binding HxlR family transcriptional regulator